jgi:hypothetical protein
MATSKANWNLEIFNKVDRPITVNLIVYSGGTVFRQRISENGKVRTVVDPNKIFKIEVEIPSKSPKEISLSGLLEAKMSKRAIWYLIPNGKNIFLSIKEGIAYPMIYPQTGPMLGLSGKTESGLKKANNIWATDIVEKIPKATKEAYLKKLGYSIGDEE